jgi:hypothetical protein
MQSLSCPQCHHWPCESCLNPFDNRFSFDCSICRSDACADCIPYFSCGIGEIHCQNCHDDAMERRFRGDDDDRD